MKSKIMLIGAGISVALAVAIGTAIAAQDKYTVKVPNGLAFSDFRGYENWKTISISHNGDLLAIILGNSVMIDAYKAGIPGNGKPFPDGSQMAKIHWKATRNDMAPGQPTVAGALHDVDFMAKDSKRFADSGGWGWAMFKYDTASETFTPGTAADTPPQGNDAKMRIGVPHDSEGT